MEHRSEQYRPRNIPSMGLFDVQAHRSQHGKLSTDRSGTRSRPSSPVSKPDVWSDHSMNLQTSGYPTSPSPDIEPAYLFSSVPSRDSPLATWDWDDRQRIRTTRQTALSVQIPQGCTSSTSRDKLVSAPDVKHGGIDMTEGVAKHKVYQCDIPGCGYQKAFSRQYELKRHRKGQHHLAPPGGDVHFYRFRNHVKQDHPEVQLEDHIKASIINDAHVRDLKCDASQSIPAQQHGALADQSVSDPDHAAMPVPLIGTSKQVMPQSLAASSVDCLTRINHAGRTDPEAEKPGHASAMELHHSSVCESRSDYACHGDTRLDTIETKQAGPVIVNPIPQPLRRRVILEMLSRVEGAFSGREAPAASPDSISITGSLDYPPRAATTPLVRPLAHPDPCTTRSMSTALSTSTQTCDAEAYLDGNDRQNPSSGAYCDHQPFRSGAQGSAGRPPSQEAAASQEEQHPDQAVRSNRKRKMSSRAKESRPYPCVYHTNGSHEDPTSHCRMHQRCVSLLRNHHDRGEHCFFYCTKCFATFDSEEERDTHVKNVKDPCAVKCVTDRCPHFGTHPRVACRHGRGGREGNGQLYIWRELFRIARPNDPIPSLAIADDPQSPLSPLPPSTPTHSLQAMHSTLSPSTLTHPLQVSPSVWPPSTSFSPLPDAASQAMQQVTGRNENASRPGSATMAVSDPTCPTSLLVSEVQELQVLIRELWQQIDDFAPGRSTVLQNAYHASIGQHPTLTLGTHWDGNSDLRRRVHVLKEHARQVWDHYTGSNRLDLSGLATLRRFASLMLPATNMSHARQAAVQVYPAANATRWQPEETPMAPPDVLDIPYFVNGPPPGIDYSNPNFWTSTQTPDLPFTVSGMLDGSDGVNPQHLSVPNPGPSTQGRGFVVYPFTQGDSAEALPYGPQHASKHHRRIDSTYGTAVDEHSSPRPAGRSYQ